ncbi:MAG: MFS transporter [Brevefilum sp.]|nr:MFS transporter [Brevefilum sp.]MDT8381537.1 MFS transporter [Brevefilum sp.]MDW7754430.1 MFS transporter [Brevefilum sp.]
MRLQFNRDTKLFLLATLLYGFSFSVWDLFFNLYILSLGFNNDMLGLIRSATPLSALVFGLPLGLLSDRIGRRNSMLIGLSIGFIGMFMQIHLVNPVFIFLFGLVQGAGIMLFIVSRPPFIMAASKTENQAMIFSLSFGLLTLANMIGNLVAGQIPGLLETWLGYSQGGAASYRWVITAGIIFASSALIPTILIKEHKEKRANARIPIFPRKLLKNLANRPVVRQFALINLITGFGAAILIPYLNVFLRGKFDISDNLLGVIFSLASLMVFLGSVSTPWLVKITHSRIIPTVATQATSIFFLFTLGFSPFLWLAAVSLLLRNVLMQMSSPLIENFAMLVSEPEEQATIASVRGMGWQTGQAIGIFISGFVQTRLGFSPLFITTGLLYTLSTFLTWVYFRPKEKEMNDAR